MEINPHKTFTENIIHHCSVQNATRQLKADLCLYILFYGGEFIIKCQLMQIVAGCKKLPRFVIIALIIELENLG